MTSRKRSISGDSQRPRIHVEPKRVTETFGDLAAKFSADYGLSPDLWQRLVLDDWLSRASGKWAALTCGLSVPRQNGKNALLEMRELFGAVGLGEKILHTAHEVKTAQKHFRRLLHFFGMQANDPGAKFPELNALVERVRHVNGQEGIVLKNGGSIEVVARSKNSGRGFTVDVLVLDEAQELSEDALEALIPTTSASPLSDPQWIFTGTPPGPAASGEVFTRVRDEAIGDSPGSLTWHEWSVTRDADLDSRDVWRMANPALDTGRLQLDVVAGERARFSDAGFLRERLGWWIDKVAEFARAISEPRWTATGVEVAPSDGVRSFGIVANHDGTRIAIAGALKHDDGVHLELIEGFSGDMDAGIRSLASWLAKRWRNTAMIAISGLAIAAPLVAALQEERVPMAFIHVLSSAEYFASSALLEEAIKARTMTHPIAPADSPLELSVASTDKKFRGQSGGWAWHAATPDGDETPIESLAVAHWAAKNTRRVPGRQSTGRGRTKGGARGRRQPQR